MNHQLLITKCLLLFAEIAINSLHEQYILSSTYILLSKLFLKIVDIDKDYIANIILFFIEHLYKKYNVNIIVKIGKIYLLAK